MHARPGASGDSCLTVYVPRPSELRRSIPLESSQSSSKEIVLGAKSTRYESPTTSTRGSRNEFARMAFNCSQSKLWWKRWVPRDVKVTRFCPLTTFLECGASTGGHTDKDLRYMRHRLIIVVVFKTRRTNKPEGFDGEAVW
jgi:hypothetical protein